MDMFTALAIVAGLGGCRRDDIRHTSMAYNGQVAHRSSVEWMGWRVAFQAAAFLFIMLAFVGSASAAEVSASVVCAAGMEHVGAGPFTHT